MIFLRVCVCALECYTVNGEDYRGRQNQTSPHGGKPCLFWNETFQHPYNTLKYPNGEGGLGAHNFCRSASRPSLPSFSTFLSFVLR